MNDDDSKTGLNFWIAALAFSVLLLATTFALLATYLAEIKGNTLKAIERSDIVAERLNTLDIEIASIHQRMLALPRPAAEAAPAVAPPTPLVAPAPAPAPASAEGLPVIQTPALASPAAPAAPPAPASPAKP